MAVYLLQLGRLASQLARRQRDIVGQRPGSSSSSRPSRGAARF